MREDTLDLAVVARSRAVVTRSRRRRRSISSPSSIDLVAVVDRSRRRRRSISSPSSIDLVESERYEISFINPPRQSQGCAKLVAIQLQYKTTLLENLLVENREDENHEEDNREEENREEENRLKQQNLRKLLTICDSCSISPSSLDLVCFVHERGYTRSRRCRSISSPSSLDLVAVVARSRRRRHSISSPSSLNLVAVVDRSRRE
ncbi:hypothetical protein F2Q69_00024005 [Brassica cretica]|uniref:Uncharacterized protein n=1 Tax=Brassica cretica TaxID=69181 RepID=A0A8S9QQM8_BRACR|nr:hypothetical protein F2Q69_00024005 [Brassica cretica]